MELVGSGVSVYGSSLRLETKLRELHQGIHMDVVYMGGSITACHLVNNETCWINRVQGWFQSAFPGQSTHHHKGVSATGSLFAGACLDTIVGKVILGHARVHFWLATESLFHTRFSR